MSDGNNVDCLMAMPPHVCNVTLLRCMCMQKHQQLFKAAALQNTLEHQIFKTISSNTYNSC